MYVSGLRNFPTVGWGGGGVPLHRPKISLLPPPGKISPVDSPQPNFFFHSNK